MTRLTTFGKILEIYWTGSGFWFTPVSFQGLCLVPFRSHWRAWKYKFSGTIPINGTTWVKFPYLRNQWENPGTPLSPGIKYGTVPVSLVGRFKIHSWKVPDNKTHDMEFPVTISFVGQNGNFSRSRWTNPGHVTFFLILHTSILWWFEQNLDRDKIRLSLNNYNNNIFNKST
jgi:hypothetical protein